MGFLCNFLCMFTLHFALLVMAPGEMQQSPVPGHLQHLHGSICHTGAQCSSGLPSVTTEQIFHFLQLLCKFHFIPAKFGRISTPSFQLCKDLLQTDSSFDLCFLTEIDNEDVTQSQEGWWDTGLPPNLSQLMEERKWSKIHVWLSRKPGEWGGLGGKWLPWRCLYNWGHLT